MAPKGTSRPSGRSGGHSHSKAYVNRLGNFESPLDNSDPEDLPNPSNAQAESSSTEVPQHSALRVPDAPVSEPPQKQDTPKEEHTKPRSTAADIAGSADTSGEIESQAQTRMISVPKDKTTETTAQSSNTEQGTAASIGNTSPQERQPNLPAAAAELPPQSSVRPTPGHTTTGSDGVAPHQHPIVERYREEAGEEIARRQCEGCGVGDADLFGHHTWCPGPVEDHSDSEESVE